MADLLEIKDLVLEQGDAFEKFVARHNEKFDQLSFDVRELEKKAARAPLAGLASGSSMSYRDSDPDHVKAFDRMLRTGDTSGLSSKAMSSGSDPEGGYMILPEMDRTIDRIAPTISAMYRLANTVQTNTSKWEKLVKTGGMSMRRVAEGSGGGESVEPTYSKVSIDVHTAEVEPWVNNETLEDAFVNLENDLAVEAGTGFAEGAGAEFITGDGVGKARGLLSYEAVPVATWAWGKVGYVPTGASGAFAGTAPADAIVNLVSSLKPQFRQNASFLLNDSTLNVIRQMKDGSGTYYLWQPDPVAPFGGKLLGYPIELDDSMPDIGAGAHAVAFGDFKRAYTIVNRIGTTLIRDPFTSKGKTKFNFRRRFGGGVTHFEAVRTLKFLVS